MCNVSPKQAAKAAAQRTLDAERKRREAPAAAFAAKKERAAAAAAAGPDAAGGFVEEVEEDEGGGNEGAVQAVHGGTGRGGTQQGGTGAAAGTLNPKVVLKANPRAAAPTQLPGETGGAAGGYGLQLRKPPGKAAGAQAGAAVAKPGAPQNAEAAAAAAALMAEFGGKQGGTDRERRAEGRTLPSVARPHGGWLGWLVGLLIGVGGQARGGVACGLSLLQLTKSGGCFGSKAVHSLGEGLVPKDLQLMLCVHSVLDH